MTSLRREAEALAVQLAFIEDATVATNIIEAFAKAQRREEVETMQKRCIGVTSFTDLYDWLSQRKKELEP